MKKIIIILLSNIFNFSAITETVRFATDATYAPFEFISANNNIIGFDIDIANALCKTMQMTCRFTNQAFDNLIPSLDYHSCDAVIAGMDITPERSKKISFTNSYYNNSAIIVTTKKNKFVLSTQIKNKKIGTQYGSTHQKYLIDRYPNINIVSYDSYQNAILDLKNGRLDGVFGDTAVINQWIKKDNNLMIIGKKITDKYYFGTGLGIAIKKDNLILLEKLNKALTNIKNNGTYKIIYTKWFNN
ncbi:transporter substrate-binding domain-containing protein [Candidatus Palibaumannia cicadellinicola]|uniref:Arginine ABC-transporter, arginine binding protein n=1 Tax=Candidatus Palibaumannia cicadellinicola TaxID=186490 RepID=A0A0K2BLD8_9GAMM|nr:transporter substrate-binding domain-containing protein [Candidatus Baumannia cicadellinicola]AKZ65868.1 arginine ABC-transporter, arginine binding protein [Candidatus Baumannia cicadellinicola]